MINRACDLCNGHVNDTWTLVISDDKDKVEVSGHKGCIDQLDRKVKGIKDVHKKSLDKVLKEIKFSLI